MQCDTEEYMCHERQDLHAVIKWQIFFTFVLSLSLCSVTPQNHHHHHRHLISSAPITLKTYMHYSVIEVCGLKTNRWKMLC